jgi:hypothetical protein
MEHAWRSSVSRAPSVRPAAGSILWVGIDPEIHCA